MFCDKIYPRWMRNVQKKKIKNILDNVKISGKILDLGSGPGFLEELVEGDIIAIDIDIENLKKAKVLKVLANGDYLPFKKVFDVIFCIDILHLLKNIDDIGDVLKKNGKIIASIFCNEHNFEEKSKWLKGLFKDFKIEKKFLIKTEKEWDFVLVVNFVS